ncbi:DUF5666 domain-containing protein [Roseateles puraquae]|uniref:DUF5666 domain-containing protein n=1 Tax=Roseateles puraquae TaxID=431059 RepID=UPI0031D68000
MPHPNRPSSPLEAALLRRHWLALAAGASLSACGGGGTTDEGAAPTSHPLGVATGGTGRVRSFLSAAVTATTPLVVGGITLDTRNAVLTDGDDAPLREQQLAPGMTARVLAGSIVGGTAPAVTITVDTQVAGPASWLDSRTLLVFGQRVSVGSSTVRGPGAAGAPPDVQVWGQLDPVAGRILATRLSARAANTAPMLRGLLTAVDRSTGWLQIGPLVARATNPSAIPAGLAEGAVARLTLGAPLPDGSWELIEARDDALRPPDGVQAELEGHVTQFSNARQFSLDGVPVDASRAQIEGLAQLQLGAAVEVHGSMRQGVLVATEVSAQAAEPLELAGSISALDAGSQTFLLHGWQLRWDATTRFSNGNSAGLRVGRQVAVRARRKPGSAALLATQISLG